MTACMVTMTPKRARAEMSVEMGSGFLGVSCSRGGTMAVTAARVITTPSNPPNCRPSRVSHKQEEQVSACPINLLWVLHTVKLGFLQ